jgi:hypothetical protein
VSLATFPVEARGNEICVKLSEEDLDSLLGTLRSKIKAVVSDKVVSLEN